MYIRCSQCKASMRVPPSCHGRRVSCTTCGCDHELSRTPELGKTPGDRCVRALRYSQEQGIDLASAYSVLLGIMTSEEVASAGFGLGDGNDPAPAPSAAPDAPRRPVYDRGFADAVSEGFLTVRQAVERGDRVGCASRVAQQHGLSLNSAFLVADNRLSLAEALHKRGEAGRMRQPTAELRSGDPPRATMTRTRALTVGLVALLVGAWAVAQQNRTVAQNTARAARITEPEPPHDVVRFAASPPSVENDSLGRVTRVSGSHPRSVLGAFCESDPHYARSPVRLLPRGGSWIGVFEDRGALYGIEIDEDPASGVWYTGNGESRVRPARIPATSGSLDVANLPATLDTAGR